MEINLINNKDDNKELTVHHTTGLNSLTAVTKVVVNGTNNNSCISCRLYTSNQWKDNAHMIVKDSGVTVEAVKDVAYNIAAEENGANSYMKEFQFMSSLVIE